MNCHRLGLVLACVTLLAAADGAPASIDLTLAQRYFEEMRAISQRDDGKLWGVSLYGPMLFVDPRTRRLVANQPDREGRLTQQGNVFVGQLPAKEVVGNTAITWAGVKWTMVMWPLPTDEARRAILLAHESWHRIQQVLGLPPTGPANAHLDNRDGRLWLQLEWRALAAALRAKDNERQQAVTDALLFRAQRRALTPTAAAQERALEMHEGLAEYTGVRLCGLSGRALDEYVAQALSDRPNKLATFVRSFAYLSGPAYGILLDDAGASWRQGLKSENDLGTLLQTALKIELPSDIARAAGERARRYDGDALAAAEEKREKVRQQRLAGYQKRLIGGPVLQLPLQKMQLSFDPTNMLPLGERGTIYPTLTISDTWGTLTVTGGALMAPDFRRVTVPAPAKPDGRILEEAGWKLQLSEGWTVHPGKRPGDYEVAPAKPKS